MPKKDFQKPFRTGDVVALKRREHLHGWKAGQVHIIHHYNVNQGKYCTNRGAWFNHEDFHLVRECDEKSMKKLKEDLKEED